MGGNALKQATTRRYERLEYKELENELRAKLAHLLDTEVMTIPCYTKKESYGDLDLIVASDIIDPEWKQLITRHFNPSQTVENGNVFSFDYKELQIDLLLYPTDAMCMARNYFAYNDLGNLMGRIAHSLHMILGHDGLSYTWYDPDCPTQVHAKHVISTDYSTICRLLGFDYSRYQKGFATLDEIFRFVGSSMFFRPEIFLLENRNHASRVRDAKRATYQEFLVWCKSNSDWLLAAPATSREWVVQYLETECPKFAELNAEVVADIANGKEFKKRFNGDVVGQLTGLEGLALGKFMKWLRENHPHPHLRQIILAIDPTTVPHWIVGQYYCYKELTQ